MITVGKRGDAWGFDCTECGFRQRNVVDHDTAIEHANEHRCPEIQHECGPGCSWEGLPIFRCTNKPHPEHTWTSTNGVVFLCDRGSADVDHSQSPSSAGDKQHG